MEGVLFYAVWTEKVTRTLVGKMRWRELGAYLEGGS